MTLLPPKTPSAFAHRLASLQSRAWLPPALLLLALAFTFLLGGYDHGYFDRSPYYRAGTHDELSAKNMAIVENLSPEHHFLMFKRQYLDADGEPTYSLYNRFPIGSYALIKLATLPFGGNLSAKIYAARMLMLLFFAAAAVMAYLALRRLASSHWIALTATLLAFSSPFCLYYGDAITSEAIVDIFAVLLVFHGMAVFEQEGRFRQLAVKTCAALFLGWHVYALLLPFIAFGLMRELTKTRLDGSVPLIVLRQLKHTALSLLRSRYLALGVIALLFGMSMLTINFTNEYFALNRETPLTELPAFRSMIYYTGVDPSLGVSRDNHREFIERQFHRVGAMFLPYAFSPTFVDHDNKDVMLRLFVMLGIAASGASLIGLLFVRRYTMLWATLALSGFCWALPMRHSTAIPSHHFEGLFYIGVALTLFSIILLCLRRLAGERLVAALSVAALLIFAFSTLRMSQLNNSIRTAEVAELREAAVADFEVIRSATDGKAILINSMPRFLNRKEVINYYLSGGPILSGNETVSNERSPDFIVTGARSDGLASLTPQNRILFLYEWDAYHKYITETIAQAREPLIRSDFDVYLSDDTLIYVKDGCSWNDTDAPFFLAAHPVDESALPVGSRQHGFQNLDFRFIYNGIRQSDGRCIAITPLPDYDIARISTGQYIRQADGSKPHLWNGKFNFPNRLADDRLRRIDETIAQARAPIIRSNFDVYLDDGALIYSNADCPVSYTKASFFLALYPADESDLPAEARRRGFDNRDFGFHEGAFWGNDAERCIAVASLPDYDIARIYTGQYIQVADGSTQHLWEGEFTFPNRLADDHMRRIDETIAQAGAPIIRSDFDVYLNDSALIYSNDACRIGYTNASFFLALYPADENDLAADAKRRGYDNRDFGFHDGGFWGSDGRCVAVAPLPDYDIARIYTGQYIQGADGSTVHLWEGNVILPEPAR